MPEQQTQFDKVVYPVVTQPGIRRDGTRLDGNHYADGEWVRFRNGRPKKIGGYREIAHALNGPIRNMAVQSSGAENIVFNLSGLGVQCIAIDDNGAGGSPYSRTPSGFTAQDEYVWSIDFMYDSTGSPATKVIVHAAQSLDNIKSDTATNVYYGDVSATSALAAFGTPQTVSGGIVVLQPYLFIYGSNGLIKNSVANDPPTFTGGDSNAANVSGTKIVKGLPLRGGSNSPAGLFWALDSLIRVTYVGGTAKWRYDTLSQKSTILSQNGVIDVDGVFYWAGVDRFLMYNGVIKEVPNAMNADFFFDNVNMAYRQKVWAASVPRWGEIWWHFPYGQATECNHAVIYNYREGVWYDTPIARSSGDGARVLPFPVWASNEMDQDRYRIYRHETGVDRVTGQNQVAIPSYFETSDMGFASGGPSGQGAANPNVQTKVIRVEPDFTQVGDMTLEITGGPTASSDDDASSPVTFSPDTEVLDFKVQRRMMRLRFASNTTGGDYHMGKVLVHMEAGDGRLK